MQLQRAKTGEFPYAFAGYGEISAALGLHLLPSDLDIFFIFALGEVAFFHSSVLLQRWNTQPYSPLGILNDWRTVLDRDRRLSTAIGEAAILSQHRLDLATQHHRHDGAGSLEGRVLSLAECDRQGPTWLASYSRYTAAIMDARTADAHPNDTCQRVIGTTVWSLPIPIHWRYCSRSSMANRSPTHRWPSRCCRSWRH